MKSLKRFCAGVLLALAFALPTFAGHIPCGVTCANPEHAEAPPEETVNEMTEGMTVDFVAVLLQGVLSMF